MRPAGLEPATHSLEGCCSIHLSYGRVIQIQLTSGIAANRFPCSSTIQ
jgi:hypothetical protein